MGGFKRVTMRRPLERSGKQREGVLGAQFWAMSGLDGVENKHSEAYVLHARRPARCAAHQPAGSQRAHGRCPAFRRAWLSS